MKTGQAAAGLIIAFGIITLLIIIVYFLSIAQDKITQTKFEKTENQVNEEITLLNYLRTPITNEENIADMLARYKITKESAIKTQIQAKSSEILNPLFAGTKYSWKIKLDDKEIAKGKSCSKIRSVKQEIMLYDGTKTTAELEVCD